MKFEVISVTRGTTVVIQGAGDEAVAPFEPGMDVEVAAFENQPDLARYLAAVSEAKKARQYHDEARSGDGAHAEDRALSLLLGEIDP